MLFPSTFLLFSFGILKLVIHFQVTKDKLLTCKTMFDIAGPILCGYWLHVQAVCTIWFWPTTTGQDFPEDRVWGRSFEAHQLLSWATHKHESSAQTFWKFYNASRIHTLGWVPRSSPSGSSCCQVWKTSWCSQGPTWPTWCCYDRRICFCHFLLVCIEHIL